MPARNLVSAAIQQARQADVSSGGKIIVFYQFLPWKEHLSDLEEELKIPEESKPIYVLYPDETANNWRIQAVPVRPESFDSRKALPEVWRGLRDDVLSLKSGVDGCIFVHASGFIGGKSPTFMMPSQLQYVATGNKTKEGALQLAKLALEM